MCVTEQDEGAPVAFGIKRELVCKVEGEGEGEGEGEEKEHQVLINY